MNKDIIKISIPKKIDYISLVRLATSGIAYSMAVNIDDLEDIKVAIGEACLNALMLNEDDEISLVFEISEDRLYMEVSGVKEEISKEIDEKRERELGLLIIKSLMDEVSFDENGIKMMKYIEDDF